MDLSKSNSVLTHMKNKTNKEPMKIYLLFYHLPIISQYLIFPHSSPHLQRLCGGTWRIRKYSNFVKGKRRHPVICVIFNHFKRIFYVILKLLFKIPNTLSHFHVQHDLNGCVPQCFNSPNKIRSLSLYFVLDLPLRTPFAKHRGALNSTAPIHLPVQSTIHATTHPSVNL